MSSLTYQQRNALAERAPLVALKPTDLVYKPGKPEFASLAGSTLGSVGTSADGWDGIFNAVASIVDGDLKALSVFDTFLSALGFIPGAIDQTTLAPLATSYAGFLAALGVKLNILDKSFGTGSGGGGGGGGGTKPPPPGKQPPPGAWRGHCIRMFPKGFNPDDPGAGDPCTPF